MSQALRTQLEQGIQSLKLDLAPAQVDLKIGHLVAVNIAGDQGMRAVSGPLLIPGQLTLNAGEPVPFSSDERKVALAGDAAIGIYA